jgi:RNA polymerase sigma factor (sigma-70 family)
MYRRHVGEVYRYVHAVLRNPADAEDVTQTTFMNAYRAFQRGERPEQAKNWLIAIAHNVCRQRFRQQQRRPAELPLFEDAAEVAVEEPEDSYTAEDIQRALAHLAFNQRAALVMRELEGRSYAEIAEIMGMTVGAVETLIFRGRRALREQLEGSLTCSQAELALSKQTDGVLSRAERGQLRAHLRECSECAALARRHRATRGALKALGAVPLPSSLASFFGGGSAVGVGVAAKAAAVVCAGAVVGTAGFEGAKHVHVTPVAAKKPAVAAAAPTHSAAAAPVTRSHPSPPAAAPSHRTLVHHVTKSRPVAARPTARGIGYEAKRKAKPNAKPRPPVVIAEPTRPKHRGPEPENPVRNAKEPENPVRALHAHPQHPAKPVHVQPARPPKPAPEPKPEKKKQIAPAVTTSETTAQTTTDGLPDHPSGPPEKKFPK